MINTRGLIAKTMLTNGLKVDLPEQLEVVVRDFPDGKEVSHERERLSDFWFVHWFGGELYYLRLKPGGPNVNGELRTIKTTKHPWFLRARLDDAVESVFSKYKAFRKRPFSFLAQKTELVKEACAIAKIDVRRLQGMTVTPRFELSAKIYEPFDGDVRIGIFVTISTRNDIGLHLPDLESKGLNLSGLHVVRRNPEEGQRRHLGCIGMIQGTILTLTDAHDVDEVKVGDAKLKRF